MTNDILLLDMRLELEIYMLQGCTELPLEVYSKIHI